jgi:hypothetical protein
MSRRGIIFFVMILLSKLGYGQRTIYYNQYLGTLRTQPANCELANGKILADASIMNGFRVSPISVSSTLGYQNLSAGNYVVAKYVVQYNVCLDYNRGGCSERGNISYGEYYYATVGRIPSTLTVDSVAVRNSDCGGATNGQIRVFARDTVNAPIQYSLDGRNFQNSPIFTGLVPDTTYQAVVRDSVGCRQSFTREVRSGDNGPRLDTILTLPDSCQQGLGQLQIAANSRNGALSYSINGNTLQQQNQFLNLRTGTYRVRIEDQLGCFTQKTAEIFGRGEPIMMQTVKTDTRCGQDNGNIRLYLSGGTQTNYQVLINNQMQLGCCNFRNLSSGRYHVEVRNGSCPAVTENIFISPSDSIPTRQIRQVGNVLVIDPVPNATYYWTICGTWLFATDTFFQPNLPGTYTVSIKVGDCVQNIDYLFTGALNTQNLEKSKYPIRLAPNPTSDKFVVDLSELSTFQHMKLLMTDATGRTVLQTTIQEKNQSIDVNQLPNGVYFVQILSENRPIGVQKLVVQH